MKVMLDNRELLGPAAVDDDELLDLVRASLGRPAATLHRWWVEPVDYSPGSPATGGLHRVRGEALDRGGLVRWSLFVKLLNSVRHWPGLPLLPASLRDEFVASFPWRFEIDMYTCGLDQTLPAGMRLPRLHRVHELGDDRVAVWMECVQTAPAAWDVPRFARAAHLLGRLAARRTQSPAPDPGRSFTGVLRGYYDGRVASGTVPMLRDGSVFSHPIVAAAVDEHLRADLLELSEAAPALLDELDGLPQALAHGDASPQNLLVPADEPERFVVIDWGFGGLLTVGFDLGQLLVGLAHAGELDVDALPAIRAAIVPAYLEGMRAEGLAVSEADVRFGLDASLVLRSALCSLPFELLDAMPHDTLGPLFTARARLTRYLADLGLALLR